MKRDPSIVLADKSFFIDEDIKFYCTDKTFEKLRKSVNERRYTVSETDISYRMIGNWDEYNLLPKSLRDGSGWRKFTFVEVVWLNIVMHLRDFGLPLEKIALARECLMELNKKDDTYDSFEYYVVKAWKSPLDPYVVVISDGHAEIASLPEIKSAANMIGSRDMLLVSLTAVIEEIGTEVKEKYGLLSLTNEYEVLLSEIHTRKNKKITIETESGEMREIASTFVETDPEAIKSLRNNLKKNKIYGNIEEQFEDGKTRSAKVTKRQRFKK